MHMYMLCMCMCFSVLEVPEGTDVNRRQLYGSEIAHAPHDPSLQGIHDAVVESLAAMGFTVTADEVCSPLVTA